MSIKANDPCSPGRTDSYIHRRGDYSGWIVEDPQIELFFRPDIQFLASSIIGHAVHYQYFHVF